MIYTPFSSLTSRLLHEKESNKHIAQK
jgi:hypothetical protein